MTLDRRCNNCYHISHIVVSSDDEHFMCNKNVTFPMMITPGSWCKDWTERIDNGYKCT